MILNFKTTLGHIAQNKKTSIGVVVFISSMPKVPMNPHNFDMQL